MESSQESGHKEDKMSSKEKDKKRSAVTYSRAEIRYMKSDARLMKRLQKPYKDKKSLIQRMVKAISRQLGGQNGD